jgi:predicted transposase YbfD/YdcC
LLAACVGGGHPLVAADPAGDPGLLARLESVPDPRGRQGRRYRLATLLALGVCAMTAPGHDSIAAVAQWARSAGGEVLARLGLRFDPLRGAYQVPDERTLRDAYGKVDASALARAGFARLGALAESARGDARTPDGQIEREQRRAARQAADMPRRPQRRTAFAVDGKCLRGAKRPDGSQVFVISAVRHHDTLTAAARKIDAKSNEIPAFAPLLDDIADADLTGAVVTMDALHAQRDHAIYLVEQRRAHYLVTVKGNQPKLSAQLRGLPWREVPVVHRAYEAGHGREELRELQVVGVSDLLFPHARQVLRITRRRRALGTRKWSTETVHAVTDLAFEQATAAELATWARGHWKIENSVHWIRDVTFNEDAHQARTGNTPAVLAGLRDIVRGALRKAGWVNTATARRAHLDPTTVLTLHGIP